MLLDNEPKITKPLPNNGQKYISLVKNIQLIFLLTIHMTLILQQEIFLVIALMALFAFHSIYWIIQSVFTLNNFFNLYFINGKRFSLFGWGKRKLFIFWFWRSEFCNRPAKFTELQTYDCLEMTRWHSQRYIPQV